MKEKIIIEEMIKPIFEYINYVRNSMPFEGVLESDMEDEDHVIVDPTPLECPVSNDLSELRDYIRNSKITRDIKYIIVHTTATNQNAKVQSIINYWKNNLKWKNPGYHIILTKEGFTVVADFNLICNGASGYNSNGVHISYIGGLDSNNKPLDNRTESQKELIRVFIEELLLRFPNAKILGHNEISKKACPCFEVKDQYSDLWTGK